MNHWKARPLLPALFDGTLAPLEEAELRAHVDRCARCCRGVAELAASERLLASIPKSLLPLEPLEAMEERLTALSRWAPAPRVGMRERVGMSAVASMAAAALVALMLTAGGWTPTVSEPGHPVTVAAVIPDAAFIPMGRFR